MHPAKRQRLNKTTATLVKPFRSPLRKVSSNQPLRRSFADDHKIQLIIDQSSQQVHSAQQYLGHQASLITQPDAVFCGPSNAFATAEAEEIDIVTLQKRYISSCHELTKLRQSLDTVEQALRFEHSEQTKHLEQLVSKWRSAAREAAEELYLLAKERVDKNGGLAAWETNQAYRSRTWDSDTATRYDDLDDGYEDMVQVEHKEANADAEKYGHHEESQGRSVQHGEDSFTMSMMLQQMNVDSDIIGYDCRLQSWTD